jgi:hypothetical protein
MYSLDTNVNLSVERSVERRRAVQAYGVKGGTGAAQPFGEAGDTATAGRRVLRQATALLVAVVFLGLVLAALLWA